jgi:hypothetical protein
MRVMIVALAMLGGGCADRALEAAPSAPPTGCEWQLSSPYLTTGQVPVCVAGMDASIPCCHILMNDATPGITAAHLAVTIEAVSFRFSTVTANTDPGTQAVKSMAFGQNDCTAGEQTLSVVSERWELGVSASCIDGKLEGVFSGPVIRGK